MNTQELNKISICNAFKLFSAELLSLVNCGLVVQAAQVAEIHIATWQYSNASLNIIFL